ncbi:DUF5602 domain-containing protein [Neolewinella litorea]|uniref:TTHB210-like domain-containing protein n=1 Tax=Neolewinella litorea TaxID=2562452 RepID=A0A4S4NM51_9BACT|nr:DUF5602 domain-containing protein [Neolewinella litorea]THH39428.1 hypothetical protein E4021_11795 [Neolewinella litorea]
MNTQSVFFALLLLLFLSCQEDEKVQTRFTGPEVAVGDGQAWTVVNTDQRGNPTSLAVEMDADAMEGLPTGQHHPPSYVLRLPTGVDLPPYDHITLDWNEHGHEPMHVYDVPHFDIHFYFISETERDGIGPDDSLAFNKPLPAENLPPDYLETPGGVPRMGAHVIDLQSPEISGEGSFTHTFIYGKYDGEIIFLEPMVTTEFLRTKPDVTAQVRQPQEWQHAGYYPTNYRIAYDAGKDRYSVVLKDFVSVQ